MSGTEGTRGAGTIAAELRELAEVASRTASTLEGVIEELAELVLETLRSGGTLLFAGNGGSAADAQHLAAEYVVRFRSERGGLSAHALTTDSSILTAAANDYGFQEIFARQVEALGRPGDLLILHSTSGDSGNLIRAAEQARTQGIRTAALLAKGGGRLLSLVDVAVVVPTDVTARAQELHLAIGHIVCRRVDEALMEGDDPSRGEPGVEGGAGS